MTAYQASAELIESTAQVIETAGFQAMADDFRSHPERRTRIANAMIRNITRENPQWGERFGHSLRDVTFEATL